MTKYTIKKEKDFVQIPNSILTSPDISLKAKGILALMLSLPDNWKFSIEGIASKCKESKECISNAIKELESAGYVKRTMKHGDDGKITGMEYEIFEEPYTVTENEEHNEEKHCEDKPCSANPSAEKPLMEEPSEEKPLTDKPSTENPSMVLPVKEKPSEENPWVNNTIINKKENNNILFSNIQSNPISSKRKLRFDMSEIELKRYAVEENIDYDILVERFPNRKAIIDEIVGLIVEVLCSKRETITIASDTHPIEQVKKRFESIDSGHIEYILECLDKNTSDIRNIKQYLLSVIFNAPQTMDNYYTAAVKHDLYG